MSHVNVEIHLESMYSQKKLKNPYLTLSIHESKNHIFESNKHVFIFTEAPASKGSKREEMLQKK